MRLNLKHGRVQLDYTHNHIDWSPFSRDLKSELLGGVETVHLLLEDLQAHFYAIDPTGCACYTRPRSRGRVFFREFAIICQNKID